MKSTKYPRLSELGVDVIEARKNGPPGVSWPTLQLALDRFNLSQKTFCDLFGVQTCGLNGMYPWDVEDVLEKMMSGKKQGTQLFLD